MVTHSDAFLVYADGGCLSSINCLPLENFKSVGLQQRGCDAPVPFGARVDAVGKVLKEGWVIDCMEEISKGNAEFRADCRIRAAEGFQPRAVLGVGDGRWADEKDASRLQCFAEYGSRVGSGFADREVELTFRGRHIDRAEAENEACLGALDMAARKFLMPPSGNVCTGIFSRAEVVDCVGLCNGALRRQHLGKNRRPASKILVADPQRYRIPEEKELFHGIPAASCQRISC